MPNRKEPVSDLHVELPAELYRQFKILAAVEGKSLRELTIEAVERLLESRKEGETVTEANRRYTIDLDDYRTTYLAMDGLEHDAFQLPWTVVEDLLGHPHTGAAEEDRLIVQALRAAGAPAWVSEETEGWVDEEGWGLIGPEAEEATAR